jgi:hypothetical protein
MLSDFRFDYVLAMRTFVFLFVAASFYGLARGII